jgi:tetratricopeptide (TPR) repeat protein
MNTIPILDATGFASSHAGTKVHVRTVANAWSRNGASPRTTLIWISRARLSSNASNTTSPPKSACDGNGDPTSDTGVGGENPSVEFAALSVGPGAPETVCQTIPLCFNYEADTAFCGGQLAKARGLTRRAIEASRKEDEKEPPALYLADAAVREALVGNAALAKKQAQAALVISNSRDAVALSAFALALAGESAEARRLADDLGKRFPRATLVQSTYLPSIRSADLIRSGDAGKAIEVLEAAASHELGGNVESVSFVLYPVYLRGEAYLAAKQGAAAAAEFQKILDHPGAARNEPIGALAHLELGRAYALSGDIAKAKGAYNDFLTLWKDADPDIPVLRAAKSEYAKL